MDLSAFNLQGKVALITGGAHGIGFSIAEGMAKCGAAICFNCSSEASLEKGLAAYKAAGIDAHGYVADVSDEDAVNAMVDNRLLSGGFSSRGIGFRFVVSKAQLLHDHLLRLLRRTAEQLLFGQLQLLQQPLILQREAGNDLRLFLFAGSKLCFQSCMFRLKLDALCFKPYSR